MNDEPVPQNHDSSEPSSSSQPTPAIPQPNFVSVKLKGVGGWLLFFVISQLVLRPLQYFGGRDDGIGAAQIAESFPSTATIMTIERVVLNGSMVAGILVALALLKTGDRWPVTLTKLYLVANPILALALAVLYLKNDLPEDASTKLIGYGFANAVGISIVCIAWILYFTRSKRIQATYFGKII